MRASRPPRRKRWERLREVGDLVSLVQFVSRKRRGAAGAERVFDEAVLNIACSAAPPRSGLVRFPHGCGKERGMWRKIRLLAEIWRPVFCATV